MKAIAAGMRGQLNYMGPIPGATATGLLITGTARGSFGFEFEVPEGDQIHMRSTHEASVDNELSETEAAIEMMRKLLEVASFSTDDDVLAEIVDEVHPRSIKKVKEFLDVLHERDALCALEFDGQTFRLTDRDQLDRGRLRLDDANIREDAQAFEGEIQGVLPKSRTFEFKVAGQDQVIRAKIGHEIEDPDLLNREYLHKPSKVSLHVTQVGQGRPRYVLQALPDLSGGNLSG